MAVQTEYDVISGPPDSIWTTAAIHTMLSKGHPEIPPPSAHPHPHHTVGIDDIRNESLWTTAALVLKGYEAVPIELKILLDRLFASHHDHIRLERRHRLACLGWSEDDYQRGYKIRDNAGRELCRWSRWRDVTETVRAFVKFGSTREIALNMLDELERREEEEQTSPVDYASTLGPTRKRSRKKQTRTVPCPEPGCSRMCRSQAELAIHRNSHTKERPFKCPWKTCMSAFGDKSTMKSHYSAIHLKDLKFKCKVPGCNKAFGTARSRNRHSENIKLHQQLFAQSYPSVAHVPLQFNSPPPTFSGYEAPFLPNYATGFHHYPTPGSMAGQIPSSHTPVVDCKPPLSGANLLPHTPHLPPTSILYSECKPPVPTPLYSPGATGLPPHCI